MHLTVDIPPTVRQRRSDQVKKVGLQYWQQLWHAGIPLMDARIIAAAIAKFDIAHRLPTPEQKCLITQYSPLICRAQLWRRDLLLLSPACNQKAC